MLKSKTIALLTLVGSLITTSSIFAGVAVIGNPANSSVLTSDQVKDLFLGKTKSLPNGERAKVVDQSEGSATRHEFYSSIVGRDSDEMKAHWSRLVFTGKGTPPEAVGDDAAVKAYVSKTPDGIGYIADTAIDSSVKVLYKR